MLHTLFNNVSVCKYEEFLDRLNFLPVHVRRQLDAAVLINAFKGNTACPSKLACALPQGPSGTSLLVLFTLTLRPVPLQDVFLLQTQSAGTLTYLTQIVFCLCTLVRLLLITFYFWFCFIS
jgi:hypothetical protein